VSKVAFITGITGQDGAYLAPLLLEKGYTVHGLERRGSLSHTDRINHINDIHLHYGDMTDATNLMRLIKEIEPDEIYNLAAQSHVQVSFDTPEYTANADALGTLRLLESIRILGLENKTKFYQASTSELFGNAPAPQNETTPFQPQSPYATAKLYAYWACKNYRDAYGVFASNGILFNHESPLRGETFVTRKITKTVAAIKHGEQSHVSLGNLDAKRDWGHAKDYVRAMWQVLQHEKPDDFVIATGQTRSVREFVEQAFKHINHDIEWQGQGTDELGISKQSGEVVVKIDPQFYRPNEVHELCGDASKANKELGWKPEITFEELVEEMVKHDLSS